MTRKNIYWCAKEKNASDKKVLELRLKCSQEKRWEDISVKSFASRGKPRKDSEAGEWLMC